MDEDCVTPDERMIASILREAPDIGERIEFVRTADEQTIAQVTLGVLFVHAIWSGTALLSLRNLNEVISRLDKPQSLRIIATNSECSERLQMIPELRGQLHGHGETAWIHQGRIVETSGNGYNPGRIEPATRRLISTATNS